MTLRFFSGSAATLLVAFAVFAQSPPAATEPEPELTLQPVPTLLRLHLPILGEKRGVLVEAVAAGSAAAGTGLRAGDIILEAGGRAVITGDALQQPDPAFPLVVLRRGRAQVLHPAAMENRFPERMFGPPMPGNRSTGTSVSSSAISSGSGSRAVSVSRAGDQIAIEMSLPEMAEGPIRFRGTAAEIEQQLGQSTLGEAVKREVRTVLRQSR
ncbi:PDZ domain-containing protein [Stieleria sp. ICT_E10.1]|uniref:PDZ domain-containing protein n=1 Tax=Stieleria sedimenti TaxID=2976331 RepID=UPI00217F664E|nr:PDZ domain-containing protein [Stieleria sedimenti]MCS7471640.1 PDZ domain-containing protein [Stieleria sedimenti]